MSEGVAYADILIIALIAGFILLRLRNVLGQKTGHDNPQHFIRPRPNAVENKDKIVQLHDKPIKAKPKSKEDPFIEKIKDARVAGTLKDIRAKDSEFDAGQFLDGAKMAFEMVFDAFSSNDKETLKMLLADNIYEEFAGEISKREEQENKTETTLVAVLSKDIADAMLVGDLARITVKFVTEQVTVVRDAAGEIIDGDASDTEHVENEWTFERDVTSKNPNWKIIET
ncbi:MAG: Tim44/TimA family putative adaptor protein [Alphaproteobacteria bacterium]